MDHASSHNLDNIVVLVNSKNQWKYEEFKDNKVVIRISKSNKDGQHNGQKTEDKQWSTKHNTMVKRHGKCH
jgi:hypothetical protein